MQNSMNAKCWQRMQACILGVSRGLKLFPCPVHKMKWCAGGAPQRNVREAIVGRRLVLGSSRHRTTERMGPSNLSFGLCRSQKNDPSE